MGCGRVGARLALMLTHAGNEVTVMDVKSSAFSRLGSEFKGITVLGDAIDQEVLKRAGIERADAFVANELGNVGLRGNADEASTLAEAGAERADVVIAVTGDDPRNLVLCQVAKRRFGTRRTLARINDPRNESLFLMLGIDATVNATQVMLSVLEQEIPQANLVPLLRLHNTDVEVVEAVVDARSRVTGQPLNSVDLPPESTIAVVIRKGSAFFPNGSTV